MLLDLRSIGLFRIGLSLLVLCSLPHLMIRSWVPYGAIGLMILPIGGLLFGYWSRFHSLILFVLLSFGTLTEGITDSTSILLRLLFWSTFLPLGGSYSMDAALNTEVLPQKITPFFSGWALLLEGVFCGIIIWYQGLVSIFYLDLNLFFKIGVICLGGSLLLPSVFWDYLLKKIATPSRTGLTIYYDGDCGFCKKMTQMIKVFFILPFTPLLPAQSSDIIEREMRFHHSWVVVDSDGGYHFKFEALIFVLSLSPLVGRVSGLLKIPFIMKWGTRSYEWVASHRVYAGKITRFWVYSPISVRLPWLIRVSLVFLFFLIRWV